MINLKIARIKKRLTQKELAEKSGITFRNIKAYESGQSKPPIDKLCILADTLEVTTDFLLERE